MRILFEPKPEIEPKIRASIYLQVSLKERLREIAKIEEVSLNEVCRVFLDLTADEYLSNHNGNHHRDSPWLYD
jgi:hypothetical protein